MTVVRHCRHCWGNHPGDCLVGDTGMCIHSNNSALAWRMRARMLLTRKGWRRILLGIR